MQKTLSTTSCPFSAARPSPLKDFVIPELTSKELVAYTYAIFPRSCKLPAFDLDMPQQFCPQEIERAEVVGRLHRALSHPNDRYLIIMLNQVALAVVEFTSNDLCNERTL